MKLKLKEGCVVRKIGDDCVIIPSSGENINMMRMIKLNSSATFLLEQMQKGEFNRDELVQLLIDEYAIERATAEKDTDAFITKLREQSLL
jgi:hypothetical protein